MHKVKIGYVADILTSEKMAVKIVNESNEIKQNHIEVDLGLDDKNRSITAYIWIEQSKDDAPKKQTDCIDFLHFLVVLPYHFENNAISDLSRYLHLVNKSIAFPGFCLSEPDRSVYYKNTLNFNNNHLSKSFLLDFVGVNWLIYDIFNEKIEEIATGNKKPLALVA